MYSGFEGYEIIYQKGDNSILHRRVKTRPVHGIGDKTSYGWVVKQILYLYCGKKYTYDEYTRLMRKKDKRISIRNRILDIRPSTFFKLFIELTVIYYFCVKFLKV